MVDLIPADYQRARRLRGLLLRYAIACTAVLCAIVAAHAALEYVLRIERAQSAIASSQQARAAALRGRATELERRKLDAEQTLAALRRLRGAASFDALFMALDEAFDTRIWFREVTFSRGTDAIAATAAVAAAPAGRGIASAAGIPATEPLAPGERVQIHGYAMDHAVLAEFIRRLRVYDGIAQVRLHDTSVRSYTNAQVVDFQIEIVLGAAREAGP